MLALKDVQFSYQETDVLKGISFSITKGEIVSLLGPSGCGKSTVLRLIADLIPPKAGEVIWDKASSNVSFVFQDSALMPWATVLGNVCLPFKLQNKQGTEIALDALKTVGLEGFEHRYPHALSGGQKMRVSIARALCSQPDLMLMDEPFAALDEILRFQMNQLLLKLTAEQGWSTLFVTHSVYEAAYLSDTVLVMKEGMIAGEVKPALDRTLSASDQRGSAAFSHAVQQISNLLGEEA